MHISPILKKGFKLSQVNNRPTFLASVLFPSKSKFRFVGIVMELDTGKGRREGGRGKGERGNSIRMDTYLSKYLVGAQGGLNIAVENI